MAYRANYPATVAEVLDETLTFRPATLRALRDFRRTRPWRGTTGERIAKLRSLNVALAGAYRLAVPRLTISRCTGVDRYIPGRREIVLGSNLSVISYLHEFGHHRGFDERQAVRFSANLFRRAFPRSYARLRHVAHMLVR